MLREIMKSDAAALYAFIKQDSARNYFIRLGLEDGKPVFEKMIGEWDDWGRLKAALFQRKTGKLQFYAKGDFDSAGFAKHINQLEYTSLISPVSYCDVFLQYNLFRSSHEGAYIAKLSAAGHRLRAEADREIKALQIGDLDKVVMLYEKVFSGFSSKAVMEEKLKNKKGRGFFISDGDKLVTVAQSAFEEEDSAIIVGVATDPDYQGKGLGTRCLKALCTQLLQEGKDLYLQYDNPDAGRIYEKLGFRPIDRIKHYDK